MATRPVYRSFFGNLRAHGFVTRERRSHGIRVINKTGSAIAANKLVAISGYDTTSKLPKIVLADADATGLANDVWVTMASVSDGKVANVWKGFMSTATLDTSGATNAGDAVYLSTTAGAFTSTAPVAGNADQLIVGYVQAKSSTVGQIAWDIGPKSKSSSTTTNGVGYSTGSGSTVTQITTSSTGVTINTPTGQITTVALTTAAGAEEKFTVTNSSVAATDTIVLSTTYNGAGGPVFLGAQNVAAGAFDLVLTNTHSATALNAVMVINFAVVKAVAS